MAERPTADNPQRFSEHGTRQAYEKGYCRCRACRAWKKAQNAKKHKARKARLEKERKKRYGQEQARRRGEQVGRTGELNEHQKAIEDMHKRAAGDTD